MQFLTSIPGILHMNKQFDNFWLGTLAGLLSPSIGILLFYYSNFNNEDLRTFLELSVRQKLLSPLLSLCAVVNLAVFYLFIHFEKYYSARGVIFSTFFYGLIIVILKFVL